MNADAFRADAVSAETRAFVEGAAAARAAMPPLSESTIPMLRGLMEEGGGPFAPPPPVERAEDRAVAGPHGEARVRVIRPEGREPAGVYLDIHGGGWAAGAARMSDQANLALVERLGVATVSVDYRLAPEHPYPAGPDDCETAALWLARDAAAEFGTERLLTGGGSAGAHLAVVTLLRLRDRHGFTGFAGANLIYGPYDMTMTPSQRMASGPEGGLTRADIETFGAMFLPAGVDAAHPDVSPLNADLRDLPPALFTVGTLDPLLDDSLFMHMRWLAAGNESELAVYAGGPHGFDAAPIAIAREAAARVRAFLGERLAAAGADLPPAPAHGRIEA